MDKIKRRIAINVGAGFVPGLNAVIKGAALAATRLGWELVGLRDGFDGVLNPNQYPNRGILPLGPALIDHLDPAGSGLLGMSRRVDPFQVRCEDEYGMLEERDLSDQLLAALKSEGIDAVISVVGLQGFSILYKLNQKGLNTICVPRSIENDIASTMVSFGFNSTLSFTIEMLDRARQAAQASRQVAVVEVLGEQAGWLALQSGIAAGADAIVIPEVPCNLNELAAQLQSRVTAQRPFGLVVVAQGAQFVEEAKTADSESADNSLKASLSPMATEPSGAYAINRSGFAAENIGNGLQQRTALAAQPMVLGPWARGGASTAVDRQLGLAYGAAAIQALDAGKDGSMVAFVPPDIKFVPLGEAINKVRTVSENNEFIQIARSLGIFLGGKQS